MPEQQPVSEERCYDCGEDYSSNDMTSNPMSPDNDDRRICVNCECEYSYCGDCGVADYAGELRYSEYAEEYYCSDCYSDRHEVDLEGHENISEVSFVSYSDETYNYNKFARFVGFEIETILPGDDFDTEDIPDYYPDTFRSTYDGSIETNRGRGVEFISQPMSGDRLFRDIDNMCDYLKNWNYYVNRTCGFHVHIDARDLYYKELRGIMLVTKSFEQTIKNMMPESRQSSNWCKSLNANKYDIRNIHSDSDFIDKWYEWASEEPSMDKYNGSRYCGLNLHARVYHGTIEFRYHSATNNRVKMKNWITICQSIVQEGIRLSKVIEDNNNLMVREDFRSRKDQDLIFENADLGLEKFIKYLDLRDIGDYIVRRVNKFRHDLSSADYTYISNNI